MKCVTVLLTDEFVDAIDLEAAESRVSRSALVRLALSTYVDGRRKQREQGERCREMDEACRGMDALSEKLGDWDPVRVIRAFRECCTF